MQEHRINYTQSFIAGWYHHDLSMCDELIEYYHNASHKKPGQLYSFDKEVVDLNSKNSIDCNLIDEPIKRKFINYLQQVVDLYIIKYPFCNGYDPWTIKEEINIQHYSPGGGFYKWHTERMLSYSDRHLVFMTYLNDVSDQGETEFYHQNIKIKPEKGLTIIWPADWTFTHRGIASPTQDKFIITGWFNFTNII